MVELNPAFAEDGETAKPRAEGESTVAETADNVVAFRPASEPASTEFVEAAPVPAAPESSASSRLGDNADGVRAAAQLLGGATNARWPMYLRNVKQILRAGNFDERRYGFGGLMDLLKACQRDGLVRIERDRRGGLRVFQGPNLARPISVPQPEPEEVDGNVGRGSPQPELATEFSPVQVEVTDESEPDVIEIEPVSVVDTTAELLGRAKPRAPRSRAGRSGVGATSAAAAPRARAGAKKSVAKKTTGAKKSSSRSRKPASKSDDDFGNR
jgi:hypothetical protein